MGFNSGFKVLNAAKQANSVGSVLLRTLWPLRSLVSNITVLCTKPYNLARFKSMLVRHYRKQYARVEQ